VPNHLREQLYPFCIVTGILLVLLGARFLVMEFSFGGVVICLSSVVFFFLRGSSGRRGRATKVRPATPNNAFEADCGPLWPPCNRNGLRARRCGIASCLAAQLDR
jgi:hypothetical protein